MKVIVLKLSKTPIQTSENVTLADILWCMLMWTPPILQLGLRLIWVKCLKAKTLLVISQFSEKFKSFGSISSSSSSTSELRDMTDSRAFHIRWEIGLENIRFFLKIILFPFLLHSENICFILKIINFFLKIFAQPCSKCLYSIEKYYKSVS